MLNEELGRQALDGSLRNCKNLILRGANTKARDSQGMAPIHWASINGHKSIVLLLLSHGVLINDANKEGWTALHFSAGKGDLSFLKELICLGASMNIKDDSGDTPFHKAFANGRTNICLHLLQLGADAGAINHLLLDNDHQVKNPECFAAVRAWIAKKSANAAIAAVLNPTTSLTAPL